MIATIAQRLLIRAKERGIGTLHEVYRVDGPTVSPTTVESTHVVRYVGVTDLSVHIAFTDGSLLRIMNGTEFMDGLKFEAQVKGEVVS